MLYGDGVGVVGLGAGFHPQDMQPSYPARRSRPQRSHSLGGDCLGGNWRGCSEPCKFGGGGSTSPVATRAREPVAKRMPGAATSTAASMAQNPCSFITPATVASEMQRTTRVRQSWRGGISECAPQTSQRCVMPKPKRTSFQRGAGVWHRGQHFMARFQSWDAEEGISALAGREQVLRDGCPSQGRHRFIERPF